MYREVRLDQELLAVAVDDEPIVLSIIEEIAREAGIRVICYGSPESAMPFILDNEIDMIFTDYRMSTMDGIDFIRELRKVASDIPIVMVTVYDDYNIMVEAIKAGATEFVPKPINAVEFLARVRNLAQLRRAQLLLRDRAKQLESEIRTELEEIREREQEAIIILGHVIEGRDASDDSHDMRVAKYSKIIAQAAGADVETQDRIFYAALFHDIGKGSIRHKLLVDGGPVAEEDMVILKEHALVGSRILDSARNTFLKEGGLVALTHHERYDGSGYPRGLQGDQIPFSGRIVAIADVFDSLTTRKPYREAWDFDKAIGHIREKSGVHFDPFLVDAFLRSINLVREVFLYR
jgi:two-component system response regulator RpfG